MIQSSSAEIPSYSIWSLPEQERPRERLHQFGAETLSTTELIAILLGSGTRGQPVLQLAHQILVRFGSIQSLSEATIAELCQIKGLGTAKAIQLKAAFNLGIRLSKQVLSPKYRVEHPVHAYNLVKEALSMEKREIFIVLLLDTKGCVIAQEIVSIGTLSETLIHPREVFYPAIRHKAASLILVHNHPSGDPTPSKEDYEITKMLVSAGNLMNIPVQDHLIVGESSYTSLRQQGFDFVNILG
ncbi:MAG: DNA repair protein RadC [Parachlamydiaceae bacterium]|nr:DNA repair protein RadC [Parachlamydiaceae bacterium]